MLLLLNLTINCFKIVCYCIIILLRARGIIIIHQSNKTVELKQVIRLYSYTWNCAISNFTLGHYISESFQRKHLAGDWSRWCNLLIWKLTNEHDAFCKIFIMWTILPKLLYNNLINFLFKNIFNFSRWKINQQVNKASGNINLWSGNLFSRHIKIQYLIINDSEFYLTCWPENFIAKKKKKKQINAISTKTRKQVVKIKFPSDMLTVTLLLSPSSIKIKRLLWRH